MEKKICKQRPDGNEGIGTVSIWGKSTPERGNRECKSVKQGACQPDRGTARSSGPEQRDRSSEVGEGQGGKREKERCGQVTCGLQLRARMKAVTLEEIKGH